MAVGYSGRGLVSIIVTGPPCPWQVLSSGREVARTDTTSQTKCCRCLHKATVPNPYPTQKYGSHILFFSMMKVSTMFSHGGEI